MLNIQADNKDSLSGVVERFLFQNQESNFAIFIITSKHGEFTIKGYIPNIQIGQEIQVTGQWISHAKFGKQFEAKTCSIKLPTSAVGLKRYLSSGLIKGIGPSYAERLVNYFGVDVLKIIDTDPDRLKEVSGIGAKRIEKIIDAWKNQKDVADIMVFLQDKGISASFATKIYKKYGRESVAILKENPYRLADEIWGIGFKIADEIAQKLEFHPHCPQRIAAGILFVISTATQQGHLYVELQNLKEKTHALLELPLDKSDLVKKALHGLHDKEKIKVISDKELHYITLSSYFYCEKGIASRLKNLLGQPSKFDFNLDKIYQDLRLENSAINLNEDQQRGVLSCLQNKISIITGGPGTGKTTLIKKLLSILDEHRVSYNLAAPTGRAAKRITERAIRTR